MREAIISLSKTTEAPPKAFDMSFKNKKSKQISSIDGSLKVKKRKFQDVGLFDTLDNDDENFRH